MAEKRALSINPDINFKKYDLFYLPETAEKISQDYYEQQLAEIAVQEDIEALALTTRAGLASAAYAVTGARALRTAMLLGVTVHMLAGILGLLAVLILTVVDAGELLTPGNLLLFELAWFIPGLLITEWTRSI